MDDKKYIYESPDGGSTLTRREFNTMNKEEYYGEPEYADSISGSSVNSSSVISSSLHGNISISDRTLIPNDLTWTGTNGKGYSLGQMVDRLESIEKRLTILTPDVKLLEKYEILQDLYDQYKAAEALLYDNDN